MKRRKIKEFEFYFKNETVIMRYNGQHTCFHAYGDRSKRGLQQFGQKLLTSRDMDINKVFGLAFQHNVQSMGATSGSIVQPATIKSQGEASPRSRNAARILW